MAVKISGHSIISRNPNLVTNTIDSEVVMMSIENGEYYGLDEIGSRIWQIIAQQSTINQIIDKLITEYNVERAQCEKDTFDLLHQMLQKKLIVIV